VAGPVPVLAGIEDAVAVQVFRKRVETAVAVDVFAAHALAGARRRQPFVPVPVLPAVELAVPGGEVLEHVEHSVRVEVLAGVELLDLRERVAVPVGPQHAVSVGVGIGHRRARGALVEAADRGLERHHGAEDRHPLGRQDRAALLQEVRGVGRGEAVEALVLELLRIVVERQGEAVVRGGLPGRLGELPELALSGDEGVAEGVDRLLDLHVLARQEEPRAVPHDRPAERQEREDVVEAHVAQPVLAEPGVEPGIVDARPVAVQARPAPVDLEGALEFVPPRLGDDVREASLRPAELRRGAARLDLDLLDRLDVELRADLARQGIGRRHAVHQGDDVGVARPVDVRVAVAVDVADPRGEGQQVLVVPPQDRQRVDELGGEPRLPRGLLEQDDGGPGPDLDPLLEGAGLPLERDADERGLPRRHRDVAQHDAGESGEHRRHLVVGGGGQAADLEPAPLVGEGGAVLHRQRGAAHADRDAFERQAAFVCDLAPDASCGLCAEGGRRPRQKDEEERERGRPRDGMGCDWMARSCGVSVQVTPQPL
jgi:hypothetical protein